MAVNAIIGFVAAALMYFSKMAEAYEMIIVGRLLIGFNSGRSSCHWLYTHLSLVPVRDHSPPATPKHTHELLKLRFRLQGSVHGLDSALPVRYPLSPSPPPTSQPHTHTQAPQPPE